MTGTHVLALRSAALCDLALRGDVKRWVADLGDTPSDRRAELADSFTDPRLVELALLVEDFGGAAVLEALEVAARRLRSEGIRPGHSASARGVSDLIHIVSSPPPFFASLSKNLKRACFRAGAVVIPATGGGGLST